MIWENIDLTQRSSHHVRKNPERHGREIRRHHNHPVVDFGYRIDCNGKSIFFTGDHEPWPNIYDPDDEDHTEFQQMIDVQQRQLDQALAGLDLMIADSSYTAAEYATKIGWGHGSLESSIAWACRLGVKTLACTHHEPTRSDDELELVFARACEVAAPPANGAGAPEILLAREGLELIVQASRRG